ncbi:tyrosine-type recombinase/integrase [Oceanicaulis alexandrii]|uniref:tyrosine-type recombinase/integrase n=1 Tax=Oceanicaulis alexandrii TaxID=153233 RepID=UPI0023548172|nr:tyrosine-type recombinase/integrase [Oceanicaulis alexandrii]
MKNHTSLTLPAEARNFEAILQRCEGAYSHNTLRGYRSDLEVFAGWCDRNGRDALPASPETIAAFVDAQIEQVTPSTLKRRVAAIKFAHRYGDHPDPTKSSEVLLAVRRAARRKPRRQKQAKGLTVGLLSKMIEHCPDTLAGLRDAAMISLGYDSLCRSCEVAAIKVEHLRPDTKGDWSLLVPRAKADQAGDGRIAWLSPLTADLVSGWLGATGMESGPLFRALHRRTLSDGPLDPTSIRRIIKRAARRSGVDPKMADRLSGHSMRVGAAQDMMVAGFDTLAIMQAGGWKTSHVLLRYVKNASTREVHAKRWVALT